MVETPRQPLAWNENGPVAWSAETGQWAALTRSVFKAFTEDRDDPIAVDTSLAMPLPADASLVVDGVVMYIRSGSSLLEVAFQYSGSGTFAMTVDGTSPSGAYEPITSISTTRSFSGSSGTTRALAVSGMIDTDTDGTLSFAWGLASGSSKIEVLEGSWLRYQWV